MLGVKSIGRVIGMVILFSAHLGLAADTDGVDTDFHCPWHEPRDLLISTVDDTITAHKTLTVPEMRKDLACLRDVFARQYVAAIVYGRMGISLVDRIDNLAMSISEELTPEQFVDQLLLLHSDAFDSHVRYLLNFPDRTVRKNLPAYKVLFIAKPVRKIGAFWQPLQDGSSQSIVECGEFLPKPAVVNDGTTDRYYFVRQSNGTPPDSATCTLADGGTRAFPVSVLEADNIPADGRSFWSEVLEGKYLYARLQQMTPGTSPAQQAFLDDLKGNTRELPIIFDLRQNAGGDDSFVYRLAAALRSKQQAVPKVDSLDANSLYSTASFANILYVLWQKALASGDLQQAEGRRRQYEQYRDEFAREVGRGDTLETFSLKTNEGSVTFGERNEPYSQQIVLLADKGCASACESMLEAFQSLPNVTVIGSNTGGYLHFGNLGAMVLPYSKISIWSGWRAFNFPSGVQEGLGYSPTYFSFEGDALKAAVSYLDQQTGRER